MNVQTTSPRIPFGINNNNINNMNNSVIANGNGSQKSPKRAERQTNFKVVIRVIIIIIIIIIITYFIF